MLKTKLLILAAAMLVNSAAMAFIDPVTISLSRIEVVYRYIDDLSRANAQDMLRLFHDDGTVVSTSKGRVNAKEFFNAFLPEITRANTEVKEIFSAPADSNHLVARFHFSFRLKNGELGEGEYIDEFIFPNNSNKLSEVIMFENTKF